MSSTVTDEVNPAKPVGKLASKYLKSCGYPSQFIESCTSKTRLLHDLGICGDDILSDLKVLHDEFGVDLSNFVFDKYFPSELSNDAFYITIGRLLRTIGLGKVLYRVYSKYPEVTLEMLEEVIKQRKWIF